jgi:hypothetical protein
VRRLFTAVCTAALLAALLPGAPSGAATPGTATPGTAEIPSLAGITTVEGTSPGSTLVQVPASSSLSVDIVGNEDIVVEGPGSYVGVALVEDAPADRVGRVLIAGRIEPGALCDDTGCPVGIATPVSRIGMELDPQQGRVTIPPGVYRLHLVRDTVGEPASVILRLAGLDGQARFAPGDASALQTHPLPPSVPAPQAQSLYSSGATHDMGPDTRGIMWSLAWLRHPVTSYARYGYCLYADAEATGVPGCPTASGNVMVSNVLLGNAKTWVVLEGTGYPVQGRFGQQLWSAAGPTDDVDGIALWLPLGDVAEPLPGYGGRLMAYIIPVPLVGASSEPTRVTECLPAPCSDLLLTR